MLMNILFIGVFFFEMLIAAIFFSNVAERKRSLVVILAAGTLLYEIGALVNIFLISTSWLNVTFSILANLILAVCFFKIKPVRAGFYSVLLVAISSFLEHIVIFAISSCSRVYTADYESETLILVVEIIISKILYFIIAMILLKFTHKDDSIVKIPSAFYCFPLITLVSVVCFWYVSLNQRLEFQNQNILGAVSALLLFATLYVFFSFQASAQRERELLLMQREQEKTKTDIAYFDILEKQNNDLRAYAHDAKNHLSAIKNLNTDPEVDLHISEMFERLREYEKVSHSGNRTLDVLIDKHIAECEIKNTVFAYDVKSNNLIEIEPFDLVTVLGNLLDNALEAAQNSTAKTVSLETDFRNGFSVIIVSNSCDTDPLGKSSGLLATTKSNKRLHGYGLKSVTKTVKKYNGDIAFDYDPEAKKFVVTVMIDSQKE